MVKGRMLQGARAMAEMVALCRPKVISAYPITPQTLIVEELSQIVADGDLEAEFINVEGEHSAASVCLGACAAGARVFTCSSSQGILLMSEVIFNISGMRLPVVMICVNRSVSAPLNIWNDQQDSMILRDSGWIQLYAENNQETCDLLLQAYRIAEDHRVMLPVMVCADGYVLPHAYEIVDLPDQEKADAFLPFYEPIYKLDVENPSTMGAYADPEKYMETRYMIQETLKKSIPIVEEVARDFSNTFARPSYGLFENYHVDDSSTVVVALGSMAGTIKDAIDELRTEGEKVGLLRMICYRPFPKEALYEALRNAVNIVVIEKDISLGASGAVATDMRAIFQGRDASPRISGFVIGLGGRDVTIDDIKLAIKKAQQQFEDADFIGLKEELELEGIDA
ncbi:MAG TPA: pyruvate ferredoxin oxidoreductase [Dehalococcoidia bacterium]|nr:pyruvate ferredoxin oxidoreductase [Dehalococcoidia bacterium]